MSEPWYGQGPAGYFEMMSRDVILLNRKKGTSKKDTISYRQYVVPAIDSIRKKTSFEGWIAAQNHSKDDGAREQWAFQFDKTAHLLEYTWCDFHTENELVFIANMHRGMAWRFPKLFIYKDTKPTVNELAAYKANKCPYYLLYAYVDPPNDVPPAYTLYQTTVLNKLDNIIQLVG